MKKEFFNIPESFKEQWPGEFSLFSWQDYLTAIPTPIFLITTYKDNGKPNACLQSWSSFVGDNGEFLAIIGSVSKTGHLYKSITETKECVINFPTIDLYDRCEATINNNEYCDNEIIKAGFTSEPAKTVNAPRIKECFLNLECELVWIKDHYEGSMACTMCLKVKHTAMDSNYYDENKRGRYGKQGYLYNINTARNAETGEIYKIKFGSITPFKKG